MRMGLCTAEVPEPSRRVWLRHGFVFLLLHVVLLLGSWPAALSITPPCEVGDAGLWAVPVYQSCQWPPTLPSSEALYVEGLKGPESSSAYVNGAVPSILASRQTPEALQSETGAKVYIKRVKLSGFKVSRPGDPGPVLWPLQLVPAAAPGASTLNMSDVWIYVDKETFQAFRVFFSQQQNLLSYTDGSTWLYIHRWQSGVSSLTSVTILLPDSCTAPVSAALISNSSKLAAAGNASEAAAVSENATGGPTYSSCVLDATNRSLIPQLVLHAGVVTDVPLMVFITSNVTMARLSDILPDGIAVNRPLILAGFLTQVTSIDFKMQVAQLSLMGSQKGTVTFLQLVLENLAPADLKSSKIAGYFSVLIQNNIWQVYYDRATSVPRMWLTNVTCVVGQKELDYMVYMQALFASPLAYLRQQTEFLRKDIGVKTWLNVPGPGTDSVTTLLNDARSRIWTNVVFTTKNVVAAELPVPPSAVGTLTPNKPSPLAVSIRTSADLETSLEHRNQENPSDREFILMVVAPMNLTPTDSWPPSGGAVIKQTMNIIGVAMNMTVSFGYAPEMLQLPADAGPGHLHFDQLSLLQLPQGARTEGQSLASGPRRMLQGKVELSMKAWTLLMWAVARPMTSTASLTISGSTFYLPAPELAYLRQQAEESNTFVLLLKGDRQAIAVQGATLAPDGSLHVDNLSAPGLTAANVTYRLDPVAATLPGYIWDPEQLVAQAGLQPTGRPAWILAVAILVPAVAVLMLVVGLLVWRQKRCLRGQLEAGARCLICMSSRCTCKTPSQLADSSSSYEGKDALRGSDGAGVGAGCNKEDGSGGGVGLVLPGGSPVRQDVDDAPDGSKDLPSSSMHTRWSTDGVSQGIAAGLSSWRTAVSAATMAIMQRRLAGAGGSPGQDRSFPAARDSSRRSRRQLPQEESGVCNGVKSCATDAWSRAGSLSRSQIQQQQQQQLANAPPKLLELIGVGAFGAVYKGMWRGKNVAVKVMQLPPSALLGVPQLRLASPEAVAAAAAAVGKRGNAREPGQCCQQMAIMEAVVSSTMCHPNVVQVFTYMLDALAVAAPMSSAGASGSREDSARRGEEYGTEARIHLQGTTLSTEGEPGASAAPPVAGWELKLVMEYCDQGCLRDALDRGALCGPGGRPLPSMVLSLAHDVVSALMHLHAEGIVHGDVKAANVLLTSSGSGGAERDWGLLGLQPPACLTAKVADFGLALLLGPTDTHATHNSRGTPTHMSPELFMDGHVSKASDVYAFGILLWEMMTGQRAFAGVPVPLLPHEVAREGLRPEWPADIVGICRYYSTMQLLAQACWQQQPSARPSFQLVLETLEELMNGTTCGSGAAVPDSRGASAAGPLLALPAAAAAGGGGGVLMPSGQPAAEGFGLRPPALYPMRGLAAANGAAGFGLLVPQPLQDKPGLAKAQADSSWSQVMY